MSLDVIKEKIPHREPFLFLDAIESIDATGAVASRLVKPDEPQFQGHYPGNPIMPGVLLCEAVFQLGAYFLVEKLASEGVSITDKTPVLARIKEAKFKSIVRPHDKLTIQVQLQETLGGFYFLKGLIKREDKLVLSVDFSLGYV